MVPSVGGIGAAASLEQDVAKAGFFDNFRHVTFSGPSISPKASASQASNGRSELLALSLHLSI